MYDMIYIDNPPKISKSWNLSRKNQEKLIFTFANSNIDTNSKTEHNMECIE